jgi:hypothetical protein
MGEEPGCCGPVDMPNDGGAKDAHVAEFVRTTNGGVTTFWRRAIFDNLHSLQRSHPSSPREATTIETSGELARETGVADMRGLGPTAEIGAAVATTCVRP